jgi:F0F1-type ATP synthase membrane subunit b/b'
MMRNNKRGISLLQQEETNAAEDANDNNIKQGQQAMRSSTKQLLELLDENAKVTATAGFRPRRIAKNKI